MVPYGTSTWSPRYGQSICRSARGSGWGLIQCRAHKPSLFLSVTDKRHRTRAQYLCDTIVPSASCWSVRLSLARGQTAVTKKKKKKNRSVLLFQDIIFRITVFICIQIQIYKGSQHLVRSCFLTWQNLKNVIFFCYFLFIYCDSCLHFYICDAPCDVSAIERCHLNTFLT